MNGLLTCNDIYVCIDRAGKLIGIVPGQSLPDPSVPEPLRGGRALDSAVQLHGEGHGDPVQHIHTRTPITRRQVSVVYLTRKKAKE